MAGKKVWTKEETLGLLCIYESYPEIWDSRHMHCKDRDKRSMCWQSMVEALNTSVSEVQRKIHDLRNQVTNYFPYYTACNVFLVWNGLLIFTLHYVREHAVSCQACLGMVMYLGSVLGFHFSVWTELYAVKFQMLHTLAHVSCKWSVIFNFSIVRDGKMSQDKTCGCMLVISIVNLGQKFKKKGGGGVNSEFTFHTSCRYRAYSLLQ